MPVSLGEEWGGEEGVGAGAPLPQGGLLAAQRVVEGASVDGPTVVRHENDDGVVGVTLLDQNDIKTDSGV